jgi:hypothetical protein
MSVIARMDDFAHRFLCGFHGQPSEFDAMKYGKMMYWYHIVIENDKREKEEMDRQKRG